MTFGGSTTFELSDTHNVLRKANENLMWEWITELIHCILVEKRIHILGWIYRNYTYLRLLYTVYKWRMNGIYAMCSKFFAMSHIQKKEKSYWASKIYLFCFHCCTALQGLCECLRTKDSRDNKILKINVKIFTYSVFFIIPWAKTETHLPCSKYQ